MAADRNSTGLASAQAILQHWSVAAGGDIEPFGTGLINTTYRVSLAGEPRFVLQAMNPMFDPRINLDIARLSAHLRGCGMPSPELLVADGAPGQLWLSDGSRNWRLARYIPGVCHDRLDTSGQAFEAGRLLGRFHHHVCSLQWSLHAARLGVHDTEAHLQALRQALIEHAGHREYATIAPLAGTILDAAARIPALPVLPDRLVHGDPKISNLLFDAQNGSGICMIDLDTLAYMPLPLELGDAIRSWCNPRGEDVQAANFRLDLFTAAIEGYASERAGDVSRAEWQAFVPATMRITVELAARFARDALEERYFGWNPQLFADRSEHNRVRAAGQLALLRSLQLHAVEAGQIVERAFGQ